MSIESTSESAIFERIVLPSEPSLSREAARSLLAMAVSPDDTARMHVLSESAQQGKLTPEEQQEIDNYERVGHYLSILQSKARSALRASANSGP